MADARSHGTSGYRHGCHCQVCREAHAKQARDWRAKKRAAAERAAAAEQEASALAAEEREELKDVPSIDLAAEPGRIETAFVDEIKNIPGEPPFKQTLIQVARFNARILDQIGRHNRLDVISGVQLRLFDAFDRLRRLAPVDASPSEGAEKMLADINRAGHRDDEG